ncbi:MAG TPA: hypothetical protein PK970_08435 [Hyphomicrobiaceae bacterium]|nr:hypothetical protein [Hyphomicrobiaceae bacterium]
MATIRRSRFVNPRLGIFFSIFTSVFVAAVCGLMIGELMGLGSRMVGGLMFGVTVLFVGLIGAASTNNSEADFYVGGRRSPSFFAGLSLTIAILGGIGTVAIPGIVLRQGMDAFVLVLGWISGLVLAAVVIAPFLRKFGAFTLPGYLGLRFQSRTIRALSAVIAAAACLLIAAAELKLAAQIGTLMTGQPMIGLLVILTLFAGGLGVLGGVRGASWMGAAFAIVATLAICVPATIVSLMISNLPLPQMTHGALFRASAWLERGQVLPEKSARLFEASFSGTGLMPLDTRFLDMYHAVGYGAMPFGILVIASGIAALPMLVQRAGTTPGVYDVRKAFGWAVLITGFLLLTIMSLAGFMRGYIVQQVVGVAGDQLPLWFQSLEQSGAMATSSKTRTVALGDIMVQRDSVVFALPVAAGMMETLVRLAQAGGLAAALAAMCAHIVALGTIIADDLIAGFRAHSIAPQKRVAVGRIGIGIGAVSVAGLATVVQDPLTAALAGITIAAGALFPVLALSIIWKRLTRAGAFAGLVAGLATTVALMTLSSLGQITMSGLMAAAVGGPVSFLIAGAVTRISAHPSRTILEYVRDMRVPGGEAVYDRVLRQERRGKPPAEM